MSDPKAGQVFEMSPIWRLLFVGLGVLGLFALAYGIAGSAGLVEAEESPAELLTAAIVGVALQPFAWTGLRHSRLALTDSTLTYLGFGLWCSPRTVELREITRFGVGMEKSSGGGRERILLLDLRDGTKRSIKLEMYREPERFRKLLGEVLGQEESETKTGFTGARLSKRHHRD
ncbi:MAG: hypothetical protein AAF196_18755 [Planctomycetota bacterium]